MEIDVKRFERRVVRFGERGHLDFELTQCAVELAIVCNVLSLSPMGRLDRGSAIHERMIERLALLDRSLAQLEADAAAVAA